MGTDGQAMRESMEMVKHDVSNLHPERAMIPAADEQAPGWARGLHQLYDRVVDEPMPASFADLIAQLDRGARSAM